MSASATNLQPSAAADFGRTRWSLVIAAQQGDEAQARASLAELCRRYWVPVYAYVRRCGHRPEAAAELVQGFLSHVLRAIRARDPVSDGGFRPFLRQRLERFLADDADRGDPAPPLAEFAAPWPLAEIEARQQAQQLPGATPREAFERAFALEILAGALARLRDEAAHSGRLAMFDSVRRYLTREPAAGEYAQLATALGSSPLAAVIAVKRLRQRYQELVDDALLQTVGDAAAFERERGTLLALADPAGPP